MKKTFYLLILFYVLINNCIAQIPEFISEYDTLKSKAGKINSRKNRVYSNERAWNKNGAKEYKYVNTAASKLVELLIKYEKDSLFLPYVSQTTQSALSIIDDPYCMTLVDRAILNYRFTEASTLTIREYERFKNKLRKQIGEENYILARDSYPFYTYESHKKKKLKYFYFYHGNDLLRLPNFKNYDRDYTGSLAIELGTDYLNPLHRRPVKSYQALLLGLEVYTPYIKNSSSVVDSADRPYGAFQYIGWAKYSLSKGNNFRYYTRFKVGRIGGNGGRLFQTILHEDISYSRIPLGWPNQIASGGRMAFSIENKFEYEKKLLFERFYFQPYFENIMGTFMTKQSFGVSFSNRNFAENAHNHVNLREKQDISYLGQHLKVYSSFQVSHITHNTMLEGFGVFNTTESKQRKNIINAVNISEDLIPFSPYYLPGEMIRRYTFNADLGFSYTTTYATLRYTFRLFSPETKLKTKINDNGYVYNLNSRWQKFGELGISLNIK